MSISAEVGELVNMGPAPLGERRMVAITGGTFEGPLLRGDVVGGADWQIARRDGVLELDARSALREDRFLRSPLGGEGGPGYVHRATGEARGAHKAAPCRSSSGLHR